MEKRSDLFRVTQPASSAAGTWTQLRCQNSVLFRDGGQEGRGIGGEKEGQDKVREWEEEQKEKVLEERRSQYRRTCPGTELPAEQSADRD